MNAVCIVSSSLCVLTVLTALASEPVVVPEPVFLESANGSSLAVTVKNGALVHTAQVFPGPDSIEPKNGDVLAMQTESCVRELERTLKEAGTTYSRIVKLNVYVTSDQDASAIMAILAKSFPRKAAPVVSLVQTVLPRVGARLALDAVAITTQPADQVQRKPSHPEAASTADSQLRTAGRAASAVLPIGPRVYISGQAEAGNGSLPDATLKTMQSLKKTLDHLNLDLASVVQLKAFLRPMKDAAVAVEQMEAVFAGTVPPPIVLVEWDSPQIPIEIELIAASPVVPSSEPAPVIEFLTPPWMKGSPVFARVVRLNNSSTIFISGLYGTTDDPNSVDEVRGLFQQLSQTVERAGGDLKHLAKATYYVSTDDVSRQLNAIRPEFYDPERPPSASKAKVAGTGRAGRTITFDMIATEAGERRVLRQTPKSD